MDERKYDLDTNALFAKELQKWVEVAPREPEAPQIGRDREAFLCNSLLGTESHRLTLLWEEIGDIFVGELRQVLKGAFYIYFDGKRTPALIHEDLLLLDLTPPRVIGRIHRDRDLGHSLISPNGAPMSSHDLASAALDGIGGELSPLLFTDLHEFLQERPQTKTGLIREFGLGDREGMACSVHYDPKAKELYIQNHTSGAVEVLTEGLDEEQARGLAHERHTIKSLREATERIKRPLLSTKSTAQTLTDISQRDYSLGFN